MEKKFKIGVSDFKFTDCETKEEILCETATKAQWTFTRGHTELALDLANYDQEWPERLQKGLEYVVEETSTFIDAFDTGKASLTTTTYLPMRLEKVVTVSTIDSCAETTIKLAFDYKIENK